MIPYILLFLFSCLILFWAGKRLVNSLARMAKFLDWREFVVAFFVMAFAGAFPNLFVGISSALHGIPELSFGDIVGGNVVDLTIAVALATLVAKELPAQSRTVQTSAIFTLCIAILPLLLILDGTLGRGDGILLIATFGLYAGWLFSKKERFTRIYDEDKTSAVKGFRVFIKDLVGIIWGAGLLLLAAEGMIVSASFFAERLNLPLALIGILIVGLGNAIPETYFAIVSARTGDTWMILGNLMGSVIVPATLVLGMVAFISPIQIQEFSPFAIGRIFLVASALFFLFFIRTDRKITKREAGFLFLIYALFVISELAFGLTFDLIP